MDSSVFPSLLHLTVPAMTACFIILPPYLNVSLACNMHSVWMELWKQMFVQSGPMLYNHGKCSTYLFHVSTAAASLSLISCLSYIVAVKMIYPRENIDFFQWHSSTKKENRHSPNLTAMPFLLDLQAAATVITLINLSYRIIRFLPLLLYWNQLHLSWNWQDCFLNLW